MSDKHGIERQIIPAEKLPLAQSAADLEKAMKTGEVSERLLRAAAQPQVRGYLSIELDKAGATLARSAEVIAEAMKAEHETPGFFEGAVVDVHKQPDHKTRLKASELNLRARGELRDQDNVNIFTDLDDVTLAKIAAGTLDPAALISMGPRIEGARSEAEPK